MTSLKDQFKNALVLPPFGLQQPGMRRLTGGKNMDGTFWLEIEGQGRIILRPQEAEAMALAILRALGHTIEQVPALAEVGVGSN